MHRVCAAVLLRAPPTTRTLRFGSWVGFKVVTATVYAFELYIASVDIREARSHKRRSRLLREVPVSLTECLRMTQCGWAGHD